MPCWTTGFLLSGLCQTTNALSSAFFLSPISSINRNSQSRIGTTFKVDSNNGTTVLSWIARSDSPSHSY